MRDFAKYRSGTANDWNNDKQSPLTINIWKFKNSNDTFNEERISKRDQWRPSSRSLWTKQWKITDFSIICTVWFVNQGICREQSGNLCVLVYVSINMMVFRENFEAWSLWKTKWRLNTLTSLIKGHARLFFSRKKSSLPSDFHVID